MSQILFIRNVEYDCKEKELFDFFSKFGKVQSAKICKNKETG